VVLQLLFSELSIEFRRDMQVGFLAASFSSCCAELALSNWQRAEILPEFFNGYLKTRLPLFGKIQDDVFLWVFRDFFELCVFFLPIPCTGTAAPKNLNPSHPPP